MFRKIKSIAAKDNYVLSAIFWDGTEKEYDIEPLFGEIPVFEDLRSIHGLFGQVRVDAGGYGISWNDKIDLSADEIWENGRTIDRRALAWDPHFTKLTPTEKVELEDAKRDMITNDTVSHDSIKWD